MRKKLSALTAAALLFALGLTACSSASGSSEAAASAASSEAASEAASSEAEALPETVTLVTRNGAGETVEVEFPYEPQSIAVMDMAALDILDAIGETGSITGVSKGSSIDYLQSYMDDDSLLNLGNVKTADMEAVMEADPDIIIIGGRLSSVYDELAEIAPVFVMYTDYDLGVVESTRSNAAKLASLFGAEDAVDELMSGFDERISTLRAAAEGQTAIIGMATSGSFIGLGNAGRGPLIGREFGFDNIGGDADIDTSTHGNEASFEFIAEKNPDYIFALDRDAAIGTEGAQLAAEILDNELVNMTTAARNGHVVVLAHSNVWYTAEGGISALDRMLQDIEGALL